MNEQPTPSLEQFQSNLLTTLLVDFREKDQPAVSSHQVIVASAQRQLRRRGRLILGVSLVLAAALIIVPTLSDTPSQSALAIENRDGVLHISVADAAADPDAMAADLRAEGIDAEVVAIPVVPSLVGHWVEAEYDVRRTPVFKPPIVNQAAAHAEVLRIPANFSTWIRLKVGRAANAGESFAENGGFNELEKGGALHCLGLPEMTPPQAQDALAAHGYELIWVDGDGEHNDPPTNGAIYWAWFRAPNVLDIRVDPEGTQPLVHSYDPPTGIEGPCS